MIVYVAGRVTGMKNYNRELFEEAEMELSKAGHTVLNPVKYTPMVNPEAITHRQYVNIGLTMLDCCDAIYLLNGWEKSKGAITEYAYAMANGIRILTEVEG